MRQRCRAASFVTSEGFDYADGWRRDISGLTEEISDAVWKEPCEVIGCGRNAAPI